MTAITGSTAGIRDLADNTLRLTIEIEPQFAKQAFELFGTRGTEVAIAALKPLHLSEKHARISDSIVPPVVPSDPQKPPLGPIGQWFVLRCREPAFRQWAIHHHGPDTQDTEVAVKELILEKLDLESRSQIDWDAVAKEKALGLFIQPYKRFNERREVAA